MNKIKLKTKDMSDLKKLHRELDMKRIILENELFNEKKIIMNEEIYDKFYNKNYENLEKRIEMLKTMCDGLQKLKDGKRKK